MRDFVGVVLGALLFPILLACGAGEIGQRWVDVDETRRAARGADLIREVMQTIAVYPYDEVAMLGELDPRHRLPSDPEFAVDFGVTQVRTGMLRVRAVVRDNATDEWVGDFVTYRTRT